MNRRKFIAGVTAAATAVTHGAVGGREHDMLPGYPDLIAPYTPAAHLLEVLVDGQRQHLVLAVHQRERWIRQVRVSQDDPMMAVRDPRSGDLVVDKIYCDFELRLKREALNGTIVLEHHHESR